VAYQTQAAHARATIDAVARAPHWLHSALAPAPVDSSHTLCNDPHRPRVCQRALGPSRACERVPRQALADALFVLKMRGRWTGCGWQVAHKPPSMPRHDSCGRRRGALSNRKGSQLSRVWRLIQSGRVYWRRPGTLLSSGYAWLAGRHDLWSRKTGPPSDF